MESQNQLPVGVKILAGVLFLFGLFAFIGSLFMWGEGFLFSFPPGVDYRFPITDILVNAPASIIAAIGLWQGRRFGYIAAQFVAGFYVFQAPPPYALEILIPQVMAMVVAVFLVFYLWRLQKLFR
jgi:hypothetical protein